MAAVPALVYRGKRDDSEREFLRAVDMALSLVEQAGSRTLALALDESGAIELPDAAPVSADDQAMIRASATLYLAAQLESAGLISAVETLCGLAMSGGINVDLGSAAHLVEQFWKGRNDRFHEKERHAFFARLFGSDEQASSSDFENLMIALCESLYKLDEQSYDQNYGSPAAQNKARVAVRSIVESLTRRGGGMTPFAAKEILTTIQESIRIIQQPPVKHAFGANTLWDVVRSVENRYERSEVDIQKYVSRGKSGLVVLSWVADTLPNLANMVAPIVTVGHPVTAAAEEWLESSLAIREATAPG